jgi:predicted TIM-barrel fold metal-dependent hydrolase
MMAPQRALAEWRASGLPAPALEALFAGNARRLFGLPAA